MKKTKFSPKIKVGPFKLIKYYEAEISGADKDLKIFEDIGREVITSDQYRNIGFNYVLSEATKHYTKGNSESKTRK